MLDRLFPAVESTAFKREQLDKSEVPAGHGEAILIVDVESSIRRDYEEHGRGIWLRVMAASKGADAIGTYAQHQEEIDLIVPAMPYMSGQASIRALAGIRSRDHLQQQIGGQSKLEG